MTQSATAVGPAASRATPAPAASATVVRAGRRARLRTTTRELLHGTPGRLRLAGMVAVVACVLFALVGASAFQARAAALQEARAGAAQLVRVQQIANDLVKADSLFTNGYLASGTESAAQLKQYDAAIASASATIAQAAKANPADAEDLSRVNQALTLYTARVAAARANNAQGFQVATGYLRQASTLLRDEKATPNLLPTLGTLMTDSSARVDEAYTAAHWALARLIGAAVIAAAGLLFAQRRLARATHRYLNLPLATASALGLVMLIFGSVVMIGAQSAADRVRDESYAATSALAKARIAAYTAKSAESITLIYLGTGGDYAASEIEYQKQVDIARTQLARVQKVTGTDPGQTTLARWDGLHRDLYAKAQADWLTAAKNATTTAPGSANDVFDRWGTSTQRELAEQATTVDEGLVGRYGSLQTGVWLTLAVGLVMALLAWAGISGRLEEYR